MITLAPSIAAAFLGALAFVAYLLHLRRSDVTARHARELAALKAYVEAEIGKVAPAILALDARVDALAGAQVVKAAFGAGGR